MSSLKLTASLLALLGATAHARSELKSRLRPITSEVKNAGTLHLGTGTWTRAGAGELALGASYTVVYSNTCPTSYYFGLDQGEIVTCTGGIPDTNQASVASTSIPGAFDKNPGCASSYNVSGFRIAYCTYFPGSNYGADIHFYDQLGPANAYCTPPGVPTATFNITGLPGSTSLNTQAC